MKLIAEEYNGLKIINRFVRMVQNFGVRENLQLPWITLSGEILLV